MTVLVRMKRWRCVHFLCASIHFFDIISYLNSMWRSVRLNLGGRDSLNIGQWLFLYFQHSIYFAPNFSCNSDLLLGRKICSELVLQRREYKNISESGANFKLVLFFSPSFCFFLVRVEYRHAFLFVLQFLRNDQNLTLTCRLSAVTVRCILTLKNILFLSSTSKK